LFCLCNNKKNQNQFYINVLNDATGNTIFFYFFFLPDIFTYLKACNVKLNMHYPSFNLYFLFLIVDLPLTREIIILFDLYYIQTDN
jgi:hypothetical protein